MLSKLETMLTEMNISDIPGKLSMFEEYMNGVLEWNNKVNITSITNNEEFEVKHFCDSILCADSPEIRGSEKILDLGTGGGFPGVPLAIIYPEKEFVLIDSSKKKIKIVEELCKHIGCANVKTLHARSEELAANKEYREQFDICVSRAVANLTTLAEYCLPFVSVGGTFIAYKGPDAETELNEARNAISILGGNFNRDEQRSSLLGMEHHILYIDKLRKTPTKYPRLAGKPRKFPLK
ncbi:MAG: 16S rRNA (guanine(527)-N(7))-methyltransferase RsmG [Anaerovoracaceae bacterium]|jgi:16S rRNA (guanine527-N7)-methyltransferase